MSREKRWLDGDRDGKLLQHQQVQEESWAQGNDSALAYETASGHHHRLLLPSISHWELLGESRGSSQACTLIFSQETVTKNTTVPHFRPLACLQQCGTPLRRAAASQLHSEGRMEPSPGRILNFLGQAWPGVKQRRSLRYLGPEFRGWHSPGCTPKLSVCKGKTRAGAFPKHLFDNSWQTSD